MSDREVLPSLDGLRGIAILLVVTHNLMSALPQPVAGLGHLYVAVLDRGWIGVQLFFVLSGFLITRILLQTRDAENYFSAFFGRRAMRIFPLYYASLALLLHGLPLIAPNLPRLAQNPVVEMSNWVFLTNWFAPFNRGNSLTQLWSLSVEEQFYFVWPFLVRPCSPRQVAHIALALILLSIAGRAGLVLMHLPEETIYEFTFCRMDALSAGAVAAAALEIPAWRVALLAWRRQFSASALVLFLLGAVLTKGYAIYGTVHQIVGYTILAIALTLVLCAAAADDLDPDRPAGRSMALVAFLRRPLLRRWGMYSYGIYVWHVPASALIGIPVLRWIGAPLAVADLATSVSYVIGMTVVSFLVGACSYHLFEIHFLRLKRLFTPLRRAEPPPAGVAAVSSHAGSARS